MRIQISIGLQKMLGKVGIVMSLDNCPIELPIIERSNPKHCDVWRGYQRPKMASYSRRIAWKTDESSNFHSLPTMSSANCKPLKSWISGRRSYSSRKWLSHDMERELIGIMRDSMLIQIVEKI